MNDMTYQVWTCTLVVPSDAVLPDDFDLPPRRAAMNAVTDHGVNVVACFSGWGGTLTEGQQELADAYYATDRVPAPSADA